MSASSSNRRPILEVLLLVMGFGGIALTLLVGLMFMGSSLFLPDEGLGIIYSFFVCVIGVTAGVGLIALSQILGYLRVIAAGSGPGKVFE